MRPRSANEWRSFWHHGGEDELRVELQRIWPALHGVADEACARSVERVATLLGSNAPARALASELGRIRADELDAAPDPDVDRDAAEAIVSWFRSHA